MPKTSSPKDLLANATQIVADYDEIDEDGGDSGKSVKKSLKIRITSKA